MQSTCYVFIVRLAIVGKKGDLLRGLSLSFSIAPSLVGLQ